MKARLKEIYQQNKDLALIHILYVVYRTVADFWRNTVAAVRLLHWKFEKHETNRPIRVCFLQQDPNCWNKSKALYELMVTDPRFEVNLLCVPDPFDANTGMTYDYFATKQYDCIDARVGNGPWSTMEDEGEWFDLRSLKPDYVFYQQPYDHYLPSAYRSRAVSEYAKICLTLYGLALTKELLSCLEVGFLRRVYCLYAVSEAEREYNENRFQWSHRMGIRKSKYLGTLVFSEFLRAKEQASPSWAFSRNNFRVIWTPRWTTDEKLGGSNFFRYKDFLLDYAEGHADVDILFRPHPMAFDNFVRAGQMTQQEVDAYVSRIQNNSNTSLDVEKNYDASFWRSNVLVTDISAIIVEYFVTGNPIIFCETEKRGCTYLEFFEKILSVCYVAENQQQVEAYLDQLKQGDDPLREQRQEMIHRLFGENLSRTASAIIEDLVKDFV